MNSRRTTIVACVLLLAMLAGSVLTLGRVDRLRSKAGLQEVLYFSSPKVLKRLSLGYEGLMADIYWTRAVQYFGRRHRQRAEEYKLLAPLLEITTSLDPHLVIAYQFGANFLSAKPPNGAGMPERAVELVESGIRANPEEWRLYYNLGFIYYLELHDYGKAAEAFERGSKIPHAHPFLKVMAANMAQHAGETEMARMLWITTFESTQDRQIKFNAVAHLRALRVDDDVSGLEKLADQYRQRTGRWPASFAELVSAGMLGGLPADPTGRAYRLMPDGRVEVRNPEELPFITKGVPPGYQPGTPNLSHLNPELPQ